MSANTHADVIGLLDQYATTRDDGILVPTINALLNDNDTKCVLAIQRGGDGEVDCLEEFLYVTISAGLLSESEALDYVTRLYPDAPPVPDYLQRLLAATCEVEPGP